jgi:hypothetical protein
MVKKILCALSFLLFSVTALAQKNIAIISLETYGGERVDQILSNVTPTTDGGFITSMTSNSQPVIGNMGQFCNNTGFTYQNYRSIFRKYNSEATKVEWTKCYEYNGDSTAYYIFETPGNDYVFGGTYRKHPDWGFAIYKVDKGDEIIWSRSYGRGTSLLLSDMTMTVDNEYILAGRSHYTDQDIPVHYGDKMISDIYVLRIDSNGNKKWGKVFGGTNEDKPEKAIPTDDGGCFIVGSSKSSDYDCTDNHGGWDVFVLRLDKDGNTIWKRSYGGSKGDGARSACSNGAGGLIIGASGYSDDGDVREKITPDGNNLWIFNIDSKGDVIWSKRYGGGNVENVVSMCKSTDGNIWAAGFCRGKGRDIDAEYGNEDAYFLHLASDGSLLSTKVLGSSTLDHGEIVYPLSNGLVFAGGIYLENSRLFNNKFYGDIDFFTAILAPWTSYIADVQKSEIQLEVYPNPSRSIIVIDVARKYKDDYDLFITDISGREIYKSVCKGAKELQIDGWAKGAYMVKITTKDGCSGTAQFLVE